MTAPGPASLPARSGSDIDISGSLLPIFPMVSFLRSSAKSIFSIEIFSSYSLSAVSKKAEVPLLAT